MAHNAKSFAPLKEQVAHYHLVACDGGAPRVLAVLRIYTSRKQVAYTVHAACWLGGGGRRLDACGAGHGSTSGWGVYKPAVAAELALEKAGLRFEHPIKSEADISDALMAYGVWLGYEPQNMAVIS